MRQLLTAVTLGLAAMQMGCSSAGAGACERIAEACHDQDMGEGPAFECHELAENGPGGDAECAQKEEECVAVCAQ